MIRLAGFSSNPACALCLCAVLGCSPPEMVAGDWRTVNETWMTAGQRVQIERAQDARATFSEDLGDALQNVMRGGTKSRAVAAYVTIVNRLLRGLEEEQGITVGRTSFNLTNPENAPPEWAKGFVEDRVTDPVYLVSVQGRLAALLPLTADATCLSCHGSESELDPVLREEMTSAYPGGNGVGFDAGDLRGYFWAEVPQPTTKSPREME